MMKDCNELIYQIKRQQHFRLLRSTFDVWEYNALQYEYERQRRIVAGETATGILNITKALKCWKVYSQWKRNKKKCIRHVAFSHCLHRWFSQTVQVTHEKSLNTFPQLIANLVRISRNAQCISKMTGQTMVFYDFEKHIKGFSAVGFCGLLSFVSRYTNYQKNILSVRSDVQPTFLSNVRMLYVARCIRVESETWQGFFALECIDVPWPIHHGKLWNRHKALASLFRWALLKVQLNKWCFYLKYKKEMKKRRILLSCRMWMSYAFKKKYNTRHKILMEETLRKTLATCLLRCSWVVWKVVFFKSLKLKELCFKVVSIKTQKSVKSACGIWKQSVTHWSLLKSREEFLTKQWTLLSSLRQWRSFIQNKTFVIVSIKKLKVKTNQTILRQHFISWRMQFLHCILCQMIQKSRTETSIKYVLVVWKRQADFQKRLENFFLSCIERMTQKSIQAWRYKALFFEKVKCYLLKREKKMVSLAFYQWSYFQQWHYHFEMKKKYLQTHLNQRQLNRIYNYLKRCSRLRQGYRKASEMLEKYVCIPNAIKRWVIITKNSMNMEQEIVSVIQLQKMKRLLQDWKAQHKNLKEEKNFHDRQQRALMLVLHKKKQSLWQQWFRYTQFCSRLRDRQVACQTDSLFWYVFRTGVCSSENVFCHFNKKKKSTFGFLRKKNVTILFNAETFVTFIQFCFNAQEFIFFWASLGNILQDIILHRTFKLKTKLVSALKHWEKSSHFHQVTKCLYKRLEIQQKQQLNMVLNEWVHYVVHEQKKRSLKVIRLEQVESHFFKTWRDIFNLKVDLKKTADSLQTRTTSKFLANYWSLWLTYYKQQTSLQFKAYCVHCQRCETQLASAVFSWSSFTKMQRKMNDALSALDTKRTFHRLEHCYFSWKSLLQNRVQCQNFFIFLHVRLIQTHLLPAWNIFATKKVKSEMTRRSQERLFVRKRHENCLKVWFYFQQHRRKFANLCRFLSQKIKQRYYKRLVERHRTLTCVWTKYCFQKCLSVWGKMICIKKNLMKKMSTCSQDAPPFSSHDLFFSKNLVKINMFCIETEISTISVCHDLTNDDPRNV
ncbi:uncharacterized protein LOC128882935 isoform X2 [Hylaeus volcanicus]|uniref:uncharacterized protein LOC128882935 isoform X2 n=1 Tax=Hylaeus volcanicus TaxID=313075 RepID=UPI0023B8590E|nr:uncharacterized protein LOC128882935 isoform X2 [Hylaeus volcanicus]